MTVGLRLLLPLLALLLAVVLACGDQEAGPQDAHVSPPETGPAGPLREDGLYTLDLVTGEFALIHPYGYAPAWSPDSERLAFGVSLADDPSRSPDLGCSGDPPYCGLAIQIVEPESGEAPRDVALGEAPSWDRAGERLLFSKLIWEADDGQRRGEVHLLDLESGEDAVLATHEPAAVQGGDVVTSNGELGQSPEWSYDESSILYSYADNVYEVPSDGSGPPRVVTGGHLAAASPASSFIAVVRSHGPQSSIFVVPLDDPQQETSVAAAPSASWSPDGRYLAYYLDSPGTGGVVTVVKDPQSGRTNTLDPGGYSIDLWSPDSSRFAYYAIGEAPSPSSEILLTSGDGSAEPVRLTDGRPLAWLPDGSGLIALRSVSDDPSQSNTIRQDLDLVGLDGSAYTLVTSVPGCTTVSVSPDGTKLAISAHYCRL